ncbi:hypothetical protein GCM10023346_45860 [Arthrobacter gyeryongensis]|uniref:Uncharacterized protein n=1 Tax=Arthrobacter gyeryongensis TaxID=1650592 RepID=A0ABP9SRM8_9MICC
MPPLGGKKEPGRNDGHRDDQQRSWEDPLDATPVEVHKRDPPRAPPFPDEEPGDEESGDYEEDIDPHEAAAGPVEQVIKYYRCYGHGPKTLDILAKYGFGRPSFLHSALPAVDECPVKG